MKVYFLVTLGSILFNPGFTQSNTKYLDIEGMEIDSAQSHYSVTYFEDKSLRPLSKYSKTNSAVFKEKSLGNDIYKRSYYYETGQLKAQCIFYDHVPVGTSQVFHRNGKPQSIIIYNKTGSRIISNWDSLGNATVKDGNGLCYCNLDPFNVLEIIQSGVVKDSIQVGEWKGQSIDNHFHCIESYDAGYLKSGVLYVGSNFYKYSSVATTAEPIGGLPALYRHIGENMRYPAPARRMGVEGRVFVQFIIERDGSLSNVKVMKGIGGGCDEEALRVMKTSPKWRPGAIRGRPVKQRYTLPIIFKLG